MKLALIQVDNAGTKFGIGVTAVKVLSFRTLDGDVNTMTNPTWMGSYNYDDFQLRIIKVR